MTINVKFRGNHDRLLALRAGFADPSPFLMALAETTSEGIKVNAQPRTPWGMGGLLAKVASEVGPVEEVAPGTWRVGIGPIEKLGSRYEKAPRGTISEFLHDWRLRERKEAPPAPRLFVPSPKLAEAYETLAEAQFKEIRARRIKKKR